MKKQGARNDSACLESQRLRRGMQEDQEFKPSFIDIVSSRPGWATEDWLEESKQKEVKRSIPGTIIRS